MKALLYKTPWLLLYSRLLAAVLMLMFSFMDLPPAVAIAICVYAVMSDVLNSIIACYLKVSMVELRQMDTKTNTVFWFSCLFYLCMNHPGFLRAHITQLFILVFLELFIILFALLKFRERFSFRTLLSKFWAIMLLWFFTEVICGKTAAVSFAVVFWYGIVVQLEIVAIAFVLKQNESDVPGIIRAIKFRKGIPLKRNRFFNV